MGPKLTMHDAEMIRLFGQYASIGALAREYQVSSDTIWNVLHYRTFASSQRLPRSDRKYSDYQVRSARKLWAEGLRDHAIAKQTGMSRGAVREVIAGHTYQDVE